jgi:hypothetical protein
MISVSALLLVLLVSHVLGGYRSRPPGRSCTAREIPLDGRLNTFGMQHVRAIPALAPA